MGLSVAKSVEKYPPDSQTGRYYKCLCSEPHGSFQPQRWLLFQFREQFSLIPPELEEVDHSSQNESRGFPEKLPVFLFLV